MHTSGRLLASKGIVKLYINFQFPGNKNMTNAKRQQLILWKTHLESEFGSYSIQTPD